jgi:hypothetical protein
MKDVKVTLTGAVWRMALKRDDSGVVKSVWNKSHLLRDGLHSFRVCKRGFYFLLVAAIWFTNLLPYSYPYKTGPCW